MSKADVAYVPCSNKQFHRTIFSLLKCEGPDVIPCDLFAKMHFVLFLLNLIKGFLCTIIMEFKFPKL